MPSQSSAIEASGVARRFGSTWVLRGITMHVQRGEVVGLLGANGSGKSTLLKIIATLLKPHAGALSVLGNDVATSASEVRPLIGYLAHSPGLYDDLTARENLHFAATMLGQPDSNVDATLERVGLGSFANATVRGFSSGMQRRLSIARLMLAKPRVLLLDEPYSNLDVAGIDLMNSLIAEWTRDGAAALIVLHELAAAAGVLDRTETIVSGRIEITDDAEADTPRVIPLIAGKDVVA